MRRSLRGNRWTYALWAPIYDWLIEWGPFPAGRELAHQRLALRAGERVLLVGVGTGVDLPLLPAGITAVGVDLSPAMLAHAQRRLPLPNRQIELHQADAQRLPFADQSFDAALLSLVLSVVPDGQACLSETMRLLKPGGRAVVFDKFLPPGTEPGWGRRGLNLITNLFGTDINRSFENMISSSQCRVDSDEPVDSHGFYRVIALHHP